MKQNQMKNPQTEFSPSLQSPLFCENASHSTSNTDLQKQVQEWTSLRNRENSYVGGLPKQKEKKNKKRQESFLFTYVNKSWLEWFVKRGIIEYK